MTFIFNDDESSLVSAFTDRPIRLTGKLSMKSFADDFDKFFEGINLNAWLTHCELDEEFSNHVYEIEKNQKRNDMYVLKTNVL